MYTVSAQPLNYGILQNVMRVYYPDSAEVNATKTDYGYFFQINDGSGYVDYGYRLDLSDTGILTLVETTDPNSMDGYSATDSLVRNKLFLSFGLKLYKNDIKIVHENQKKQKII